MYVCSSALPCSARIFLTESVTTPAFRWPGEAPASFSQASILPTWPLFRSIMTWFHCSSSEWSALSVAAIATSMASSWIGMRARMNATSNACPFSFDSATTVGFGGAAGAVAARGLAPIRMMSATTRSQRMLHLPEADVSARDLALPVRAHCAPSAPLVSRRDGGVRFACRCPARAGRCCLGS